jgi:hypothetical protein
MYRIFFIFFFPVFAFSSVSGQSTFSANRPGQINNPDITPRGNLMIETGFQYARTGGAVNYFLPTMYFRYGLNENIEIGLKADNVYQPEESLFGLTSYNLAAKIKICDQREILPKISLVTAYYLPFIGLDSLRPDYAGGLIQVALSHSLGNKFTLYGNLGALWSGNDPFAVYNYVISLYFSPAKRFWTFAELYGLVPGSGSSSIGTCFGISCQAMDNFQIDLSFGGNPSDLRNNYFVQIGAAIQIVKR